VSTLIQGDQLRALLQGVIVYRATAALPATTDAALFTISGGDVLITGIYGEVTTVIQTQTNATKLKFNPDATGADVDICATLDITADAVGTRYSITGDFSDALKDGLNCLETDALLERPIVLSEGAIEIDCAATNTGSVAWKVTYIPLDNGASIAAA
jgi:hypothetical protein